MSNLMDKIANKLGASDDSENASNDSHGMNTQDQSFSTQDQQQSNQGYQQRSQPQESNMSFNPEGQGTMNQSGTQDQTYGMYDQEDPGLSSGRKQTGVQQGYGTTDVAQEQEGEQEQFQRRF